MYVEGVNHPVSERDWDDVAQAGEGEPNVDDVPVFRIAEGPTHQHVDDDDEVPAISSSYVTDDEEGFGVVGNPCCQDHQTLENSEPTAIVENLRGRACISEEEHVDGGKESADIEHAVNNACFRWRCTQEGFGEVELGSEWVLDDREDSQDALVEAVAHQG